MDSSKAVKFSLRRTSAVSLNERFSQVLVDQVARSRMVTFDPVVLQQRKVSGTEPLVLLVQKEPSSLLGLQVCGLSLVVVHHVVYCNDSHPSVGVLLPDVSPGVKQCLRRRSVWTRLGWQQVTRRLSASKPRGFWSFRNKYKWKAKFTSTYRRRGNLQRRLCQHRLLTSTNIQKSPAGQHPRLLLQRGRGAASKWQGQREQGVPTKKQLDAQLDEYMSLSKSRLDQQLDDYMSMSRQRLDAELDEYMSMAGEMELHWD